MLLLLDPQKRVRDTPWTKTKRIIEEGAVSVHVTIQSPFAICWATFLDSYGVNIHVRKDGIIKFWLSFGLYLPRALNW